MVHRYLCDVLDEMRKCFKTRNFSHLLGLIEEAQVMANRMEAGLDNKRDYRLWYDKCKEEQEEFNRLRKITDKLRKKNGEKPLGKQSYVYGD